MKFSQHIAELKMQVWRYDEVFGDILKLLDNGGKNGHSRYLRNQTWETLSPGHVCLQKSELLCPYFRLWEVTSSYFSCHPSLFLCRNRHRAMCSGIHQPVLLDSEERHVPSTRSTAEASRREQLRQNGNVLQLWIPGRAQDRLGEFYTDLHRQRWARRQPFRQLLFLAHFRKSNSS